MECEILRRIFLKRRRKLVSFKEESSYSIELIFRIEFYVLGERFWI